MNSIVKKSKNFSKKKENSKENLSREDFLSYFRDKILLIRERLNNFLISEDSDDQLRLSQEIHRALKKIDTDDYGFCENSGEEISFSILDSNPFTRYSHQTSLLRNSEDSDTFLDFDYQNDYDDDDSEDLEDSYE